MPVAFLPGSSLFLAASRGSRVVFSLDLQLPGRGRVGLRAGHQVGSTVPWSSTVESAGGSSSRICSSQFVQELRSGRSGSGRGRGPAVGRFGWLGQGPLGVLALAGGGWQGVDPGVFHGPSCPVVPGVAAKAVQIESSSQPGRRAGRLCWTRAVRRPRLGRVASVCSSFGVTSQICRPASGADVATARSYGPVEAVASAGSVASGC